jgi:tetratricopeptide (TPR) repeat protein
MKYFRSTFMLLILSTGIIEVTNGQSPVELRAADSFYTNKKWVSAKAAYEHYLKMDSSNSMQWNRLGFCNQNLKFYQEAIRDYKTALANNPSGIIKSIIMLRLSMVYSILNKTEEAKAYLLNATTSGYNSLKDLDSLDAFKNLRTSSNFSELRKAVFEIVYPCSKEPRNRDFDFWIGDWNCYRTGTDVLSGYSHVESIAGGCAILENFTSIQSYDGKSFNFYDTITGKWEQDWIGSGGPGDRQHYNNGIFKDGKMQFVYETTNSNGVKAKGNFIFYFINQDSVRQYQDLTDSTGKTVSVTYDLTYRRKK